MKTSALLQVGCNYWASHAGMFMWRRWDGAVVEKDLELLAGHHLKTLRVFPLWQDFQPIEQCRRWEGIPDGITFADSPLPDDEWGRAGIDPVMMARFRTLLDLAQKNGIKLIVGLLTGWMSGRLFVPHALESRNLHTDPVALHWEVLFVRAFVRAFKGHPAIAAWDLGNECNCMSHADADEAWNWNFTIASAIRLEDAARPVVSGMHTRDLDRSKGWNVRDLGELNDVLTTHPYPLFSEHMLKSAFHEFPETLQSAAETIYNADLGGKPCFIEEAGSLSPMLSAMDHAAAHLRTALYSALVHGIDKYLWWCAFEQNEIEDTIPYERTALERRLGLFTADYRILETGTELARFAETELPFDELPPRTVDAVCLLSRNQDQWRTAFGALVTAKRAGYELQFADSREGIPEAEFYLLPCVSSDAAIDRRRWRALLDKVRAGAKLLVTMNDGFLDPFEEIFGCRVDSRILQESAPKIFGSPCPRRITLTMRNDTAEIVDCDGGDPVILRQRYGRGMVEFVNAPLEYAAIDPKYNYGKVYADFFAAAGALPRVFSVKSDEIGVTVHRHADGRILAAMVNYGSRPGKVTLTGGKVIEVPGNDARFELILP